MNPTFKTRFRSSYGLPNGLQVVGDQFWIVDQVTDRVALIEIDEPTDTYNFTRLIREIPSQSSNTSGLAYGENALWLAANGAATRWRSELPSDAKKGLGEIFKVDPATGQTLNRYPVPGGGGVHGIEYDPIDPDHLWITTLKSRTLSKVRIQDWDVVQVLDLAYPRAHGVVRVEDGIWVVHTADRLIVKLDLESGAELDRIAVPEPNPEPHGLSIYGQNMLYCDATSGWIVEIVLT